MKLPELAVCAISNAIYTILLLAKVRVTYNEIEVEFERTISETFDSFIDKMDNAIKGNDEVLAVVKEELVYELTEGNYFDKSQDFTHDLGIYLEERTSATLEVINWFITVAEEAKHGRE